MKTPKSLNKVTTFSKIIAILVFFLLLTGAFYIGMLYQQKISKTHTEVASYEESSTISYIEVN